MLVAFQNSPNTVYINSCVFFHIRDKWKTVYRFKKLCFICCVAFNDLPMYSDSSSHNIYVMWCFGALSLISITFRSRYILCQNTEIKIQSKMTFSFLSATLAILVTGLHYHLWKSSTNVLRNHFTIHFRNLLGNSLHFHIKLRLVRWLIIRLDVTSLMMLPEIGQDGRI